MSFWSIFKNEGLLQIILFGRLSVRKEQCFLKTSSNCREIYYAHLKLNFKSILLLGIFRNFECICKFKLQEHFIWFFFDWSLKSCNRTASRFALMNETLSCFISHLSLIFFAVIILEHNMWVLDVKISRFAHSSLRSLKILLVRYFIPFILILHSLISVFPNPIFTSLTCNGIRLVYID